MRLQRKSGRPHIAFIQIATQNIGKARYYCRAVVAIYSTAVFIPLVAQDPEEISAIKAVWSINDKTHPGTVLIVIVQQAWSKTIYTSGDQRCRFINLSCGSGPTAG